MKHLQQVALVMLAALLAVSSAHAQERAQPLVNYVPGQSVLYAYYQGLAKAPTSFRQTALYEIVKEPEVQAFGVELSRFIDAVMTKQGAELPITWPEVRALLDCEAAFGVVTIEGPMPGMMLVVRPGEHVEKVRTLVDRLIAKIMPPDQPIPEEEMDGVLFRQAGPISVCWMGNDLVLVLGRETMRTVVRTMKGLGSSIAQEERFKTVGRKTMGGKEFLTAHFNLEKFLEQRGPRGEGQKRKLTALGVDGLSSVHLTIAPDAPGVKLMLYAHTPRGRQGVFRMLPVRPINEKKMLAGIPRTAANFSVFRANLVETYDVFVEVTDAMGEREEFDRDLARLKAWIGFDLRGDLLTALGDDFVVESLGPGLFMMPEMSVSVGVKDEAAVKGCLDKLAAAASELEKQAADRPNDQWRPPQPGIDVEKLDYKGRTMVAVKATGAPMPWTPSFAVSRGRLIVGVVPQTVKKALDAQGVPVRSITDATAFSALRSHVAQNPTGLSYSEFREGFEALYSGLPTYLIQMTHGIPRLPRHSLGAKFPSSNAIAPHLFGTISAFSYDGEGFLFESYGTFGGGMGLGGPQQAESFATVGILAGFLLPGVATTRQAAHAAASMNNVRQIGASMVMYAGDHDDEFPASFGVLLKDGYLTSGRVFFHPASGGRVPPGFPAEFRDADLAALSAIDRVSDYVMVKGLTHDVDADFIILHERQPFGRGGRICCFNDGHCQFLPEGEFQRKMARQKDKIK